MFQSEKYMTPKLALSAASTEIKAHGSDNFTKEES